MGDERYSIEERIFMVLEYETTKNFTEVQRRFRRKFKRNDPPSIHTIKRHYENFLATGSVQDHYRGNVGGEPTAITEENIQRVKDYFQQNPRSSIRQAAPVLNLSYSTVQRILTKKIEFYPYKVSIHQPLADFDRERRVEFASHLLAMIDGKELDVSKIWFSDEAHFWLHGYVNKQNYRIWGSENPHFVLEKPLHPKKVTVWIAVSGKGLVDPVIFDHTVTGQSYEELLRTKFIPQIRTMRKLNDFWFMQDGARPHRTESVFQALHEAFDSRIIGLGSSGRYAGAVDWPPYSPDLNPCDYWLWGHLKDFVYHKSPKNVPELKNAILEGVKTIGPEVARRAIFNFVVRLQHIVTCEGNHIENILN